MINNHNRQRIINALQRKSRTARDLSSTTKIDLSQIYIAVNKMTNEGIVTFKLEKNIHGHLIKKYSLINTPHSHGM